VSKGGIKLKDVYMEYRIYRRHTHRLMHDGNRRWPETDRNLHALIQQSDSNGLGFTLK
jgi:hypothetical protein